MDTQIIIESSQKGKFIAFYSPLPLPLSGTEHQTEGNLPIFTPSLRMERKEWDLCPEFWFVTGLPEGLVSVSADREHE